MPTALKAKDSDKTDLFRDLCSEDKKTRGFAVRELKKNATSKEITHFINCLRLNDWAGKIGACKLLSEIGDEQSITKLKEMLLDFSPRVRLVAEKSLRERGIIQPFLEDEVVELVGFLTHPSWWVRTQAVKGLEAIGDKRALEPITRLLLDEDDEVRQAAREAVNRFTRHSI